MKRILFYLVFCFAFFTQVNQSFAKEHHDCRIALVEHGHYTSIDAVKADPFAERAFTEIERFINARTDAPHMTAEQIAKHNSYRIVPRNQTPIEEAKVVFVAIHGNGGGNSGPHSLTGVLTQVQRIGVLQEGSPSGIYVEAPALPGAEAGPNRNNYDTPEKVVEWTLNYLRDLRAQMGPDAKLVIFTRSSGADFGIKAALDEGFANESGPLIDEVIAMSPTTTGINPEDKPRIKAAEDGAIIDLQNNGSGINAGAFGWITKMLNLSKAWVAENFRNLKGKTKFTFLSGSEDKQVPIIEREYTSQLVRDSDGALLSFDYLRALHDTFASADGYDPHAQAYPALANHLRENYFGIAAPDAQVTPNTFRTIEGKTLGNKTTLGSEVPVTPKTLVAAFEAGVRFEPIDLHIVKAEDAAKTVEHNKNAHHGRATIFINATTDLINAFRRASGIPLFKSYRKAARVPNLIDHAKNGRLVIKKSDGSEEFLKDDLFQFNEVYKPDEINSLIQSGRLVERQYQYGKVYYLPIYPSNFEVYTTWRKLTGEAQKKFGLEMSRQEKGEYTRDNAPPPQAKENLLINFNSSAQRGDIMVLPEGMHVEAMTPENIEAHATSLPAQRFDSIYFTRYSEIEEAAEKKKLYIVNSKGSIEYISPDAVREYVAQRIADRKRAEGMIKTILEVARKAEENGKTSESIIIVEGETARPLSYSETIAFLGDPEKSILTFHTDPNSPASLRSHAWVKPVVREVISAENASNSEALKNARENAAFKSQKDQNFWAIMNTAKNEVSEDGTPFYDVHSWLLPQALYHEKNGHSIEVTDAEGNLIAGAILLNKGDHWSIDTLIDIRMGNGNRKEATSANNNPALQKAFADALEFAFKSGAKTVDIDRVRPQITPVFGNEISQSRQ